MYYCVMDIKTMRKITNKTQQQFAEYMQIPVANIRNWEQGFRIPPNYIVRLLERILFMDGYLIDVKKVYHTLKKQIPYQLSLSDDGQYDITFCYRNNTYRIPAPYFCHARNMNQAFLCCTSFAVENKIGEIDFQTFFERLSVFDT